VAYRNHHRYRKPSGANPGTALRRVVSFYTAKDFEALDKIAEARGVGIGVIQREMVIDTLREEPPLFYPATP
jgi:hypothetical protein